MDKKTEKINWLIEQLDLIIGRTNKCEAKFANQIAKVHPRFSKSAKNLIHYRALRTEDIRVLQKKLGNMGLSRLAKSESHVMAGLIANKDILKNFLDCNSPPSTLPEISFKESRQLEKYNTKKLLGYRSEGRRTRIMVTIPTQAAEDYQMIYDMIKTGMNCARINCAHDDTVVWKKMIDHIRTASQELKRNCKIAMDLGGPKIRTGSLLPGPKVIKFRPTKNNRGETKEPCKIWLGKIANPELSSAFLPVDCKNQHNLKAGHQLYFKDARGKKRTFVIVESNDSGCLVHAYKTSYLESGLEIYTNSKYQSDPITVGEIPPIEQAIILQIGDTLRLHKKNIPGENAQIDSEGNQSSPAHISCTLPQILQEIKVGESIFFDDGKIEGVIREVNSEEAIIEILHTKTNGGKLKADKGINLPTSQLSISGLTEKDKKDLEFVVEHADVVNLSFVNSDQDVRDLLIELNRLEAPKNLGVVLKIETQSGFNNLTEILMEAMQVHPLGLMIARGDLAVESGWKNMARVQEEILALCQAAHVPTIWATQVLESLSKQGTLARAEITDAAMALRADAVMLNKGPYILESIDLLSTILTDLAPYREKNARLSPRMEKVEKVEKTQI